MATANSTLDPYRIRDHVADFDAIVADIRTRSARARSTLAMCASIPYGADPTETVDLFFPADPHPGMPVHLFIHGGYWRMFSKEDYSCVAETITQSGAIAVIVDYALMPAVRMAVIVDQIRRAKRWVIETIADYGGDPARLTVSGHSAGAHLATFLFDEPENSSGIQAALLLGGLYELQPLQASFLRDEIGITDAEVSSFSPMRHRHDRATRVVLAVGEFETPPFHQQAEAFGEILAGQGLLVERLRLPLRNHMDSVRDLGVPGSDAAACLAGLIMARGSSPDRQLPGAG